MPGPSILEGAIKLALVAHEGQRDWCGRPFILHPIRVGMSLLARGEELAACGVLHDSVEDSDGRVTYDTILAECGSDVARIVDLLTHEPSVPYEDYILAVSMDPQATLVKLADLADNIAPDRLMVQNDKQLASLVKHGKALQRLRNIAKAHGWL
jgi:(p)ppGpp synthase/HD superfamily hydrolase